MSDLKQCMNFLYMSAVAQSSRDLTPGQRFDDTEEEEEVRIIPEDDEPDRTRGSIGTTWIEACIPIHINTYIHKYIHMYSDHAV